MALRLPILLAAAAGAHALVATPYRCPGATRITTCTSLPSATATGRAPLTSLMMASMAVGTASAGFPAELMPVKTNALTRFLTATQFLAASVVTILFWYIPLVPLYLYSLVFDRSRRRACDWIVQIWARCTLSLLFSDIRVEGLENLPPRDEAVMYVPNHCSFLDIFALSGYLPRRFKYISKIEILRIPFIGWAMQFAKHIAIKRMDRASQVQTVRDAVDCLKAGSSLVTFPEGTRSKDGRLMEFKKGPFSMAAKAQVRVVPISIIGTHLFQPPGSAFPMARPRGVKLVVHPPLDAPGKKKEQETLEQARAAVLSALPKSMQPLKDESA